MEFFLTFCIFVNFVIAFFLYKLDIKIRDENAELIKENEHLKESFETLKGLAKDFVREADEQLGPQEKEEDPD